LGGVQLGFLGDFLNPRELSLDGTDDVLLVVVRILERPFSIELAVVDVLLPLFLVQVHGLDLGQLFVLQLLDVAQRLHARAVAVDVAARYLPARAQRGEACEA